MPWLANNVLCNKYPWWGKMAEKQGFSPQVFPEGVPVEKARELLAGWHPYTAGVLDEQDVMAAISAGLDGEDLVRALETTRLSTHKLVKADVRDGQPLDTPRIGLIGIDAATHTFEEWLIQTVESVVKPSDLVITSACLFKGRAQGLIQIERPECAYGPGGFAFSPTIAFSTSLDGSWASQINQTVTIVECDNTARLGRMEGVSFKHTSRSASRLQTFQGVAEAIMRGETDFKAILEELATTHVSDKQFSNIIESLIPIDDDATSNKRTRAERKRQEVTQIYNTDNAIMAGQKGTLLGAWQAFSTWNQHMSQLRNTHGSGMDDTNLRAHRVYQDRGTVIRGKSGDEDMLDKMRELVSA